MASLYNALLKHSNSQTRWIPFPNVGSIHRSTEGAKNCFSMNSSCTVIETCMWPLNWTCITPLRWQEVLMCSNGGSKLPCQTGRPIRMGGRNFYEKLIATRLTTPRYVVSRVWRNPNPDSSYSQTNSVHATNPEISYDRIFHLAIESPGKGWYHDSEQWAGNLTSAKFFTTPTVKPLNCGEVKHE